MNPNQPNRNQPRAPRRDNSRSPQNRTAPPRYADPRNFRAAPNPANRGSPGQNARNGAPGSRPPVRAPRFDPRLSPEEIARRQEIARQRQLRRQQAERQRRLREQREREQKAREKELRRLELRENLKILGGRLLVLILVVVCLGVLFAGCAALVFFFHTPDAPDDSGKITYFYGGEEIRKVPAEDALVGGSLYFCFNDLSDYLGMAESGTSETMRFVLPQTARNPDSISTSAGDGSEESAAFSTDTRRVSVNGQDVQLDLSSVIRGTEIWVSSSFIEDYFLNLSCRYDEKSREVRIAMIKDEENSDSDKTVYLPVSLQLKNAFPIDSIAEDPLVGDVTYGDSEEGAIPLNFSANLASYEEYMNPSGEMRDAFLTLVNPSHVLTETDIPTDLVDLPQTASNKSTQQLREYAAKALDALFQEMHAAGFYDMAVYSGYRTYSYQSILFDQYTENEMSANPSLTREQAEEVVLTYSTRPGTSEHQTGLAVDMDTMGTFTTDFAFTEEYAWLQENSWKFGFVLRFPQEKVSITSIQFEPWHYRYVGRYHAQKMYESGLCLEEYTQRLAK